MAFLKIKNVAIRGLSACVGSTIEENITSPAFDSDESAKKFINSTGIERKRKTDKSITASDLCFEAAKKLIKDLNWKEDEIDCLIFVTQTPDYILPATSCLLQDRLGLSEECYTLDISLGCSGWIYGMSTITSLISSGNFKRGLLLAGDTILNTTSTKDKSTYPIFGDAGTATAVEFDTNAGEINFHLATDGSGYKAIIIPDGGYRNQSNKESFNFEIIEDGIVRDKTQLILMGMDVFAFGISKAPDSVNKLIEHYSLEKESVDFFVFHQANMFMNEKIRKKLKLPLEKVPYSLKNFGNTSSASIPLTIITELKKEVQSKKLNCVGCGFGVGLSWGSASFELDKIVCCELIEL